MKQILAVLLLLALTACASGRMIPGQIYPLDGSGVIPMEIEVTRGQGRMTAYNPETGEKFEGSYTAMRQSAVVYGSSTTVVSKTVAPARAFLKGDQGTTLNVTMDIQAGFVPTGMGDAVDQQGRKYQVQF